MLLNKLRVLLSCAIVCSLCSCGSASTKTLNDSTAKDMIQDKMDSQPVTLPLSIFSRYMVLSRTDYAKATVPISSIASAFKALVEAGLVEKHAETIEYPVVSGVFSTTSANGTDEFDLHVAPNSNDIIGTYTSIGRWGKNPTSEVTGQIAADGAIQLMIHPAAGLIIWPTSQNGHYVESGSNAYLKVDANGPTEYAGKAARQKFHLVWYTYSWSQSLQKKIVGNARDPRIAIAKFEVHNISDLKLETDTQASSRFTWSLDPNDLGKIMPAAVPSGTRTGTALFAKRPDGTWFLDTLNRNF